MADIEFTTNSPEVIGELKNISDITLETGNAIAQSNLIAQASFDILSESVVAANENVYVFGSSVLAAVPALIGATAQTDMLSTSVTALNTNIATGIALWNEFSLSVGNSTLSMLNNTLQTDFANASVASLSGSIESAAVGIELMSGTLIGNTDTLFNNNDQILLNSGQLLTATEKMGAEQVAAENSTVALDDNLTKRQNLNTFLSDTSFMSGYTKSADCQTTSFDLLTKSVEALTTAEGFLAAITAVNTALSLINNAITLKETISKRKNAAASAQESVSSLASAFPKAFAAGAGMGLPGLVWLAAMLALFGAGMAVFYSMKSSFTPAMATGGVVSSPTVALVGEGRYPEAVVPLGDSPQFATMKADIAGAVLQGLASLSRVGGQSGSKNVEVVLNIDGDKFARAVLPAMDKEYRRSGRTTAIRSV